MSGVSTTQPLRELAERVMREQGWSLADLARNGGGRRQKSWYGKVLSQRDRPTPLRIDEVEALAAALRLTPKVVRAADLAGHGLMEIADGEGAVLPEAVQLTPRQRAAVQAVIRAMTVEVDHVQPATDVVHLAPNLVVVAAPDHKERDQAARTGEPDLDRARAAQNASAEAPHPDAPEDPA